MSGGVGGGGGGTGGGGYGEKTYWDARYASEDKYDWYLHYAQFRDQLLPHLNVLPHSEEAPADGASAAQPPTTAEATPLSNDGATTALPPSNGPSPAASPPLPPPRPRSSLSLLIVGCGNSELSAALLDDGFTRIDSCDYSQVVIHKMQDAYQHRPLLKFHVQDVRCMSFPSGSFDAVLDKGTLDAILCGADSSRHATSMLSECQRVLKPSGCLLLITYGAPASRLSYLEQSRYAWDVSYEVLGGTRYLYVCSKKDAAATAAPADTSGAP